MERHSVESSRGFFDEAAATIERATGQGIAKRQVEGLTARAASDVEAFYAGVLRPPNRRPTEAVD